MAKFLRRIKKDTAWERQHSLWRTAIAVEGSFAWGQDFVRRLKLGIAMKGGHEVAQ